MSRQFKLAKISALRKTTATLENVSASDVQKSAGSYVAGNSFDPLIEKTNETITTTKEIQMNANRKTDLITKATHSGQASPFNHSPVFLLACIMALNQDIQAIAGKIGFTIPDPDPGATSGTAVQNANDAKTAEQVAAEKAALELAAKVQTEKAKQEADNAATAKAAALSASPM